MNIKDLFKYYYTRILSLAFIAGNFIYYQVQKYPSTFNVVLIDLFILFFFMYFFWEKLLEKIDSHKLLEFLNVSDGSIKFTDITTFLGEQALGSLFATLTIVFIKGFFITIGNEILTALVAFLLYLIAMVITMVSLTRFSLQIIRLKLSITTEVILILILFGISQCLYIGGLKLAS